MGGFGQLGIPSKVLQVMELLRWADYPRCKPFSDYEEPAREYRSLKQKVKAGRRMAEAMRRGP